MSSVIVSLQETRPSSSTEAADPDQESTIPIQQALTLTQQVGQSYCGRLKYFKDAWLQITADPRILSWISGYKIPFITLPVQNVDVHNDNISEKEVNKIDICVHKLLEKGAINSCKPCNGQFLSKMFTVPKPNGDNRFILNLKNLNKFIHTEHFKLEDLRTATKLMSKGCYMSTTDLKDAYFLVPIHNSDKKYLRFAWKHNIYEFQVLPFGLNTAPYVFTKILKPVMQHLRSKGLISVIYLDDIWCCGRSSQECADNVQKTVKILSDLGFIINFDKSSLIPQKCVKFLGFILNSEKYHIALPTQKRQNIKDEIHKFLNKKSCKIRELAHLTGLLVSACPAIQYGFLYTKELERQKFIFLQKSNNNYERTMPLSDSVVPDLKWWLSHISNSVKPIRSNNYCLEIFSDSSITGWGGSCGDERAAGLWNEDERKLHINYLELVAASLALKVFANKLTNCEILLRIDNTTAISYINRMGGIQYPHFNSIANQIWKWCESRNIYVFASYIKSAHNVIADEESRKSHSDIECEPNNKYFDEIVHTHGAPDIDLFASRANAKCDLYVAWKNDSDAFKIDTFTLSWKPYFFYAFPPFVLITKVLQKIVSEQSEGIVVVPDWPTQPWYPLFQKMMVAEPLYFGPCNDLLKLYSSNHQFRQRLTLVAARLSGKFFHDEGCQEPP